MTCCPSNFARGSIFDSTIYTHYFFLSGSLKVGPEKPDVRSTIKVFGGEMLDRPSRDLAARKVVLVHLQVGLSRLMGRQGIEQSVVL